MPDAFERCHPIVNFVFFAAVLVFSMLTYHPWMLGISLLCGLASAALLTKGRFVRRALPVLLPVTVLTALINPSFNHAGITILTYLPDGNPLTLESILFGVAAAGMLTAVLAWFSAFNVCMTSDKLVWLFGRITPHLSLLLAMTLRFVPRFAAQARRTAAARRAMGGRDKGALLRLRHGAAVLSGLITWALENAVETADSMRSRGYGLPGRSAYSLYRMSHRDIVVLVWELVLTAGTAAGLAADCADWNYFPRMRFAAGNAATAATLALFALLCLTPIFVTVWEAIRWRASTSET